MAQDRTTHRTKHGTTSTVVAFITAGSSYTIPCVLYQQKPHIHIIMVASAIFITDLSGKSIIFRNYRGDIPLTKSIDRFANYLKEVEEDNKKPIFCVDADGSLILDQDDVPASGLGVENFVYIQVGFVSFSP